VLTQGLIYVMIFKFYSSNQSFLNGTFFTNMQAPIWNVPERNVNKVNPKWNIIALALTIEQALGIQVSVYSKL
jgi:hypothetical protein